MEIVNQCIACGKELPEGNHVCKECMDKASNYQPREKRVKPVPPPLIHIKEDFSVNKFKAEDYDGLPTGCMAFAMFLVGLSLIALFLSVVVILVAIALSIPLFL